MNKERRLGRGLEALLGRRPKPEPEPDEMPMMPAQPSPPPAVPAPPSVPASPSGPTRLDMSRIDRNPAQPRKDFDETEMESLSESLRTHGLLQPVVVRRVDDRYELIAGERRLRAAQKAGWADVPVNIIEADDRASAELAIVENMQRQDLNPLEKAASFQRYLEQYGCTQEELAARLKLDRSTIANLIRLLELPEAVQNALRNGTVTQGHARALLPLGEEREQVGFCERIQREGLNVRQTETLVQEMINAVDGPRLSIVRRDEEPTRSTRPRSEHIAALEQELRSALGTKVNLTHNAKGKGKMVIHFAGHEEFERIRRYLLQQDRPEVRAG
ncbi:MAG: ParB/RepB/Spo0J family partition protein [Planctomycetota bacterium]